MTTMTKKTDAVKVRVYGKWKTFKSREEAMTYFQEGMLACDGAERDRYTSIYFQLKGGATVATD